MVDLFFTEYKPVDQFLYWKNVKSEYEILKSNFLENSGFHLMISNHKMKLHVLISSHDFLKTRDEIACPSAY